MSEYQPDPTYRQVAEWLPADVRDAIAATTPCISGDEHDWQHTRTEIHKWGQVAPVAVIEHWLCRHCGVDVGTDPEDYA